MNRRLTAALLALLPAALIAAATLSPTRDAAAQAPSGKASNPATAGLRKATFGSGCFWCTESDFDKVDGVVKTISGYMGGKTKNPTYQQVTSGRTGHAEVVQITYDPTKVTYQKLLDHYWRNVDPYTADRQFCDAGSQYRPVIFTHDAEQRRLAEASKTALEKSGRLKHKIVVAIQNATEFTRAEEYHQDFYKKNPGHYHLYRSGCRRDARLREIWGPPTN